LRRLAQFAAIVTTLAIVAPWLTGGLCCVQPCRHKLKVSVHCSMHHPDQPSGHFEEISRTKSCCHRIGGILNSKRWATNVQSNIFFDSPGPSGELRGTVMVQEVARDPGGQLPIKQGCTQSTLGVFLI
jgi:hypothetical protein